MGCSTSKEKGRTLHERRKRAGVGHTERLGSKPPSARGSGPKSRRGSWNNYSESKAAADDESGGPPPKLNDFGQLMPEELVKRTQGSIRSKRISVGNPQKGGMIKLNYAYVSQRGYYPDDVHKANQDAFSVTHKVAGEDGDSVFVVYDGHGNNGHDCANFAKSKLPQLLAKYIRQERCTAYRRKLQAEGASLKGAYNPKLWPKLTEQQYEGVCRKAFLECNEAMHKDKDLWDSLSGTTAISAGFHFGRLTVCNVGDSRVVLGHRIPVEGAGSSFGENEEKKMEETKEEEKSPEEELIPANESEEFELSPKGLVKGGTVLAVPLSRDQTPFRLDERERVKKAGGVIMSIDQMEGKEALHENWGDMVLGEDIDEQGDPPRVWMKGKDFPGTAFTRSLGDSVAESIGVIAEPEILTAELNSNDEILVVASDGLFEFLTNQSVIDICAKCENAMEACQQVVKAAYEQWLCYEDRTDDITVIVCFMSCSKEPSKAVVGTTDELIGLARDRSGLKPTRTVRKGEETPTNGL